MSLGVKTVTDKIVKKTPKLSNAPSIPKKADEKARSAEAKIDSRMKFMGILLIF